MKNQRSLGLVVEGNATSSLILRLPNLVEELGPIKAGALRVARRLSNFLRAGYPVNKYEDLHTARLVLVRVPDAIAPRVVEDICRADLALKETSFVLCETCLSTDVLKPLRLRGASTATLMPVQTVRKDWYVIEGQMAAMRQVRRLLERNEARAFELRQGAKSLYFAAELLSMTFPLQLLASAQQALRAAGISGNHLHELLEEMSLEMFRLFSNGVRLTWPGARTGCSPETSRECLEHLHVHYPEIAAVLEAELQLPAHSRPAKMERPPLIA